VTRPGGVWRNWSRAHEVHPRRVEFPSSIEAVRRAVRAADARGLRVKAVGSGHSFSPIAVATDVLVDLRDLRGVVSVDRERRRVRLYAGTRLWEVPRLLAPYGWAMTNLGDIDRQTIAGAISTGTHGTGATFGGLSTQIVALTLVTADGEVLAIDEEQPELLAGAVLGLGALGVLVDVTVQCVPAFVLAAVERPEPLDDVLSDLTARAAASDHFEYYWFPGTSTAVTKSNERLPESAPRNRIPRPRRWWDETVMANGVYRVTCAAGRVVPPLVPVANRIAAQTFGNRDYTEASHAVFTQRRSVRFREMEYAVPVENLANAFADVRALVAERGWRISFPVEVRLAAGDDRWLSTAYGRDSGYIAVHRYFREDPAEYFGAVEELMLAHGGRPHWGKEHTLDSAQLRARYPRFDDFVGLRDRLDPGRMFTNPYLDRVLGG
jgi:L-gulono-1,4-lactone dehydrogenase